MALEDIDGLSEKELNAQGHVDDHKKIVRGLKGVKGELEGRLSKEGLAASVNDFKGTPLSLIDPIRDLPNVLGSWDSSLLQGTVGSGVDSIPDASGWGQDLVSYTTSTKPMTIALRNGKKVIRTNGQANYLSCTGWGKRWGAIAVTGPVTVFAVAGASTSFDGTADFPRTIWSGAQWDYSGTITGSASIGSDIITATINPTAGEYVRINTTGLREVAQVLSVSGSSSPYTITLTAPLTQAHESGVAVATNPSKLQLEGTGLGAVVSSPVPSSSPPPSTHGMNDGELHVHATVIETNQIRHLVDGLITTSTSYLTPTSSALVDLYFGGMGGKGLHGDVAQLIICQGALTPTQINSVSSALCAKWGISFKGRSDLVSFRGNFIGGNSSNGQSTRIFPPPPSTRASSGSPLVIWSHPNAANEKISISYFSGPVLAALNNMGFIVAASNLHGNSWGNQSSIDDNVDLYNRVSSYFGTPSSVIMIGGSMGGLASLLAVNDGRIPNIKGVYLMDGVCNLGSMYGSGGNLYSSTIETAYGLANSGEYAAKTDGHDPMILPASVFSGKRFRFMASDSDTDVPRTSNADDFATRITGAIEREVITHPLGHLSSYSANPADVIDFAKRCLE